MLKSIEIEINGKCNRQCSYCPNSIQDRSSIGEMSLEEFETILNQLDEIEYNGILSFHFYNEPLLHSRFLDFVKTSKLRLPGCCLHIYTNGTLLTYDLFKKSIEYGVSKFIVTKHESEGRSYVFDDTFLKLSPDEKKFVLFKQHNEIKKTNRAGLLHIGANPLKMHLEPCQVPRNMIVITRQGQVLPCFEDFQEKMVVGNVFQTHLQQILMSGPYLEFVKKLMLGLRQSSELCKNCNRGEVLFYE